MIDLSNALNGASLGGTLGSAVATITGKSSEMETLEKWAAIGTIAGAVAVLIVGITKGRKEGDVV